MEFASNGVILNSANTQYRIRIAGIDAPEKAQPFGEKSKQNMARLAFQKDAVADCPKRDRYGREVCTVIIDGIDVGLAQLDAGLAWWYRKYAHEQLPSQRLDYEGAETKAASDLVDALRTLSSAQFQLFRNSPTFAVPLDGAKIAIDEAKRHCN